MNDEQEKTKLWKIYTILIAVMLGGTTLVLGAQYTWSAIQQQLAQSAAQRESASNSSSPSTTTSAPTSTIQTNQQVNSSNLSKLEALNAINKYLQAKGRIFGSSYDREFAATVATGELYYDIVKPGGRIDTLQKDNAYWKYGVQKAEPLAYFSTYGDIAEIDVKVTEELLYYENNSLKNKAVNIKDYRFILKAENGIWKLADRKNKD